jgi:phosphoribosylformylglycinamidine cyclo-ligase
VALGATDLAEKLQGRALADAVLEPTRIYVKPVLRLLKSMKVKGLAHVTGGGLPGNLPRILPGRLAARIERSAWTMPPLFRWLQERGNIADEELFRVFNCGIGMVAVVRAADSARALRLLKSGGVTAWRIGEIVRRPKRGPQVVIV